MKIGVISDTHLTDKSEIPGEILEAFAKMDMIIHAGDISSLAVLDKLKTACKNINAVYGNMDPEYVRKKLPEKQVINVGSHRIGVAHGYGHPNGLIPLLKKLFKDDFVDIIIFGHSHIPLNEKRDDILYFNPGSPTDKIFSPYNSYGILEINDNVHAQIVRL